MAEARAGAAITDVVMAAITEITRAERISFSMDAQRALLRRHQRHESPVPGPGSKRHTVVGGIELHRLGDQPKRDGCWVVIGQLVSGYVLVDSLSIAPRLHPKSFEPEQPTHITRTEVPQSPAD